jgi:hypothetical protein
MHTASRWWSWWAVCAVVWVGVDITWAQAPAAANPLGRVKLSGNLVRTPRIQAQNYNSVNPPRADWFQIEVLYETRPEWVDELKLTFYVLMKSNDPKEPFVLLKGEDTFIHIARGTHRAHAYVHPSILKRYGRVEGYAVEFSSQGRPLGAEATDPTNYRRWIQQLAPKDGFVLMPRDTPFAHLDYEAFEMSKPRTAQ